MIAGAGVLDIKKDKRGDIHRNPRLYELPAKLTVLGISPGGVSVDLGNKAERNYWIVDDSWTGVWQYDASTVYVPFDKLQHDLGMGEQIATNKTTGEKITMPARTTDIHIKVAPGRNLADVRAKIQIAVEQVMGENRAAQDLMTSFEPRVETWEEDKATYLNAIENEKLLVTFLFGIISVVAIFLIFCIFYMIVVEKTKDIGIIKSVGATAGGVAGIFLGYGAAIGVVGAGLGLLASYLIVTNINYIHTKMGELLGIQIWNPEVYLFDKIPNTMEPREVVVIVGCAIVASVLGALVPAMRAAQMNPVEALRWE
jgi:lipoprotein-releasing system permease protein